MGGSTDGELETYTGTCFGALSSINSCAFRVIGISMPLDVESYWREFQAAYPRREAWGKAEKAFRDLAKKGKLPAPEVLAVAIRCQQRPGGCLERVLSKDRRDLRPLPASWLNAERWHDEWEPPMKETAGQVSGVDWTEEKRRLYDQRIAAEDAAREEFLRKAKATP